MPANNKEDNRAQQRKWYKANKAKKRARVREIRIEKQKKLNDIKVTSGCKTCDENHIACLTFHHREPSKKFDYVSQMLTRGFAWEKLLEEVKKCDVLCMNCHRKLHWEENMPL